MWAANMASKTVFLTNGQYQNLSRQIGEQYQAQIARLQQQVEDGQEELEETQSENAQLQLAIQNSNTQIATLQGQITTLQGELTTATGQITTLQGQVTAANAEVTRLNGQLQEANILNQGLQGQLDILRNFGLWPNAVEAITTDTTLSMNTLVTMAFPSGWGGSYVCSYQLQNDNQLYHLNPTQGVVGYSINWLKSTGQILWADSNGNSQLISNVQSVRIEHNATFNNRIIGFYYNN